MTDLGTPEHMSQVYRSADGRKVYVGDAYSANLGDQLEALGVVGVLNVAYDLDDNPVFATGMHPMVEDPHRPAPEASGEEANVAVGRFSKQVQYAKVGLIDGTHNPSGMMGLAAAAFMANQLWQFPKPNIPCPPLVNVYPTDGSLLIHCWSGRSRSVTVAALFLWYQWGVSGQDPSLSSFLETYAMVKEARGDSTEIFVHGPCPPPPHRGHDDYTQTPPTVGMQEAALQLTQTYAELFPTPS